MKFRPDVEGLRAVAIVPVVLYHAKLGIAPGGFVGVDVFFVISGFLISRIIFDDLDTGRFSIGLFYRRRIRRIFPALYFMLAAVCLISPVLLSPAELEEFGKTVLATVFFVSNMEFIRLTDYFGGLAELKPLLHMWSLAVEEQFYILFPLILVATRKWGRAKFVTVFLVCAVLSLAISVWTTAHYGKVAFFSAPPRAVELLIGALVAVEPRPSIRSRWLREGLTAAGFCMILCSIVFYSEMTPFPGYAALLPCLGAAAIIYGGCEGQTRVGVLLSLPPVRFIGSISYSLYLWHWPMLVFARHLALGDPNGMQTALAIALAVFFATVSLRYVERPFRGLGTSKTAPFVAGGALVAAFGLLATVTVAADGFPGRYAPESLRLFRFASDFNKRRGVCHSGTTRVLAYERLCRYGSPSAEPSIALWADSHGVELVAGLEQTAARHGVSMVEITSPGCPPSLGYNPRLNPRCAAQNAKMFDRMTADARIKQVIVTAHFAAHVGRDWDAFAKGFEDAVIRLHKAGKQVVIVYPWAKFDYPIPVALGHEFARVGSPLGYVQSRTQFDRENAVPRAMLDSLSLRVDALKIDPASLFCDGQACITYRQGKALYFDDNHLTVSGAEQLAPMFVNVFERSRARTAWGPVR